MAGSLQVEVLVNTASVLGFICWQRVLYFGWPC